MCVALSGREKCLSYVFVIYCVLCGACIEGVSVRLLTDVSVYTE